LIAAGNEDEVLDLISSMPDNDSTLGLPSKWGGPLVVVSRPTLVRANVPFKTASQ
jgi:hypothetical protein